MRDDTVDTPGNGRTGAGLPGAPDWAIPGCERRSEHVTRLLASMDQEVGDLLDLNPAFLSTSDKRDLLVALTQLEARVTAARLRVIAGADDVAEADGARDVAAWLAATCQTDRATAHRDQRLAHTLAGKRPVLGAALAAGAMGVEQAQVIATGLDRLPPDVPADLLGKAETHLVGQAAHHGPNELRILARRVLDVIAPELGETEERKALEREEAHAFKTTRLTTRPHGDGTTSVIARVPDPIASRLLTYLHAFTNPRRDGLDTGLVPRPGSTTETSGLDTSLVPHDGSTTELPSLIEPASAASGVETTDGEPTPYDVRLGHAFCTLLEHYDPSRLPIHGGDATTVIVTIDHNTLTEKLGGNAIATTSTGDQMSAGQARRLACAAGILPAILDSKSKVLDLGTTKRLFTPNQRKALAVRDRQCRADGCTIPAAWCEAHHQTPWSQGGNTDLNNGLLLCSFHHHRAHDPSYQDTTLANGDHRYHRRT